LIIIAVQKNREVDDEKPIQDKGVVLKNKILPKEGAMKKIIISAMAIVMMLVSIGGCWPWWYEDGRGGRGGDGGGRHRSESHEGHHR
jgi:hypothetical protein